MFQCQGTFSTKTRQAGLQLANKISNLAAGEKERKRERERERETERDRERGRERERDRERQRDTEGERERELKVMAAYQQRTPPGRPRSTLCTSTMQVPLIQHHPSPLRKPSQDPLPLGCNGQRCVDGRAARSLCWLQLQCQANLALATTHLPGEHPLHGNIPHPVGQSRSHAT